MTEEKSWNMVATSPDCRNYVVREEKSWKVVAHLALAVGTTW